jgi:SAM-dependent methyltransferase
MHGGSDVPRVTEVFGKDYASVYDVLYDAKDYQGEVDLIERVLVRHGAGGPRHLLDLGCGTGNHALPLARRGHSVVGVDRSASMLAQARTKASAILPGDIEIPRFYEGDIRNIDLGERFDAALMMFTVMGYLKADDDLMAALKVVRQHLNHRGLFIFDVWNGLAVLADKPRARSITVTDGTSQIVRNTRIRLDEPRHLCHVYFDLRRVEASGESEEWTEEHVMRFYFPQELELALHASRFELLQFRSFSDDESLPDEKVWNLVGVARAR